MPTKRIQCNFFIFEENEEGKLNQLFEQQKQVLRNRGVTNVTVSNFYLRITDLEKKVEADKHWWLGIIERLETTEEVESSNLQGNRVLYATGEDEGPIKNTGFLYDPQTKTLVLHRKIGGVNDVNFGIFIRKLLVITGVIDRGKRGYKMHILPDLSKLDRLHRAPHIHALEYSIKLPDRIPTVSSNSRSIIGDLLLANRLGGDYIKVKVKSDNMNVQQTIRKVLKIRELGEDNVVSLRVITEHNDIEEPLDLLSTKFTDYVDINLNRNQRETITLIMDTIFRVFQNQRILIEQMYINRTQQD